MSALLWLDGLLAEFCSSFTGPLREEARRLPFTLGFARDPITPWSRVFNHEVTLAAPAMVAEAMPGVPRGAVKHALVGHALAVIEAMGTDRIEDGQVVPTPALCKVLGAARSLRDEHLVLAARDEERMLDPAVIDLEFNEAIRLERDLLVGQQSVDFALYESLSKRKQVCGILGVDALAVRAGWDERRRGVLRRVILGAALGLQLYDDVVDWEEDAARGRSWVLALVLSQRRAPRPWPEVADAYEHRARVLSSGVVARMLRRGRLHFRAAARRARAVGAVRLGVWCAERAELIGQLADRESQSPGFVIRARALAPWARTVLQP